MPAQNYRLLVCQPSKLPATGPIFPNIPFLLRASVVALWMLPPGAYAQVGATPVVIETKGDNGRNASTFRSSTSGKNSSNITFVQPKGASLETDSDRGAIRIESQGGMGGEGHNGIVSDTTGSRGGATGDISVSITGSIKNNSLATTGHGLAISASGGNAGSRMRGGVGGGSAGPIKVVVDDAAIRTTSATAAAINVNSNGGNGNSGFQAVGIRWSGSDGGAAGLITLDFAGGITAAGRGIDLRSRGGQGGSIDGGVIQTVASHGGAGGRGGDLRANLTGLSNGAKSTITTSGAEGHALKLLSQGGDGGYITGSTWLNGANGGSGGAGGGVSATVDNASIRTSGANASGIWAESDGGKGFWGGGSRLARGGTAGSGGDGGKVSVILGAKTDVITMGAGAVAVQAISRGGGGGKGGEGGVIYSPGGDGSSGGAGGEVTLTSAARIETTGKDAHALYAASLGGAAGDGGKGGPIAVYAVGGNGGANSHSSKVELTNTGSVVTRGEASHGLFAQSIGGDGGDYRAAGQAALGGDSHSNSPNANGAEIVVVNRGSVEVEGKSAKGILAQSIGGGGGSGGSGVGFIGIGGNGSSSGNGSTIRVKNDGSISTRGEQGYAIHAQSIGGGGGNAGSALSVGIGVTMSVGGSGGVAGNGGEVNIVLDKSSEISTLGADAAAVVAQSIGGGGGDGGVATSVGIVNLLTQSLGGSAGAAGRGGAVNVQTDGSISTMGEGAAGVLAQSVGGGGGIGGNGSSAGFTIASMGVGGVGGGSGNGDAVTFTNKALIETRGNDAHGALLQSIGGGGGAGGNAVAIAMSAGSHTASASLSIGGTGGDGGDAGRVQATNLTRISTAGAGAKALIAQSIGGGGGAAGSAGAFSASFASGTSISLAIAIGRSGGNGGKGGEVVVDNAGDLVTAGDHATGLLAQSIGGGGGAGGAAAGRAVAYGANSFAATVAIGGSGGSGGNGGGVTVTQQKHIHTSGNAAIGLLAQSVGGGGGNGGLTHGDTHADTANVSIVLGRSGGSGGDGGEAVVKQVAGADIATSGIASDGMLVQSIGGGGGVGSAIGDSDMPPWPDPIPIPGGSGYQYEGYSGSLTLALGGKGGNGGVGGAVSVTQAGRIATEGRQSNGLVAQSIGGGGGRSGTSASSAPGGDLSLSLSLGGAGGAGGDAGTVQVTQSGTIYTAGLDSAGLLAQSIGGGGGNASASEAGQSAGKLGVNVAIGGSGGTAGQGGAIDIQQTGTVSAKNGDALVAQSIGGGGGYAGAVSAVLSMDATAAIIEGNPPEQGAAFTLAVGGKGGAGGNGGAVSAVNSGMLSSGGDTHAGALLQSIGGGGGAGGVASTAYETSMTGPTGTVQVSMAVGGNGGSAGDGGKVTWIQTGKGAVQADGLLGDGVRLQSIGGGGGVAGGVAVSASETRTPWEQKARVDAALISVAGKSGANGVGGAVDATNDAQSHIGTTGNGGIGLVAQSIGGGGGLSYAAYKTEVVKATIGLGGGSGAGGLVSLYQNGIIATEGSSALGLLAQSIGGGGGASRVAGAKTVSTVFNNDAVGVGNGATVDLVIGKTGSIVTQGTDAYGILAQSIGGGGGYASSGTAVALSTGTLNQKMAGTGDGGTLNMTVDGRLITSGERATAVIAQSIGGGGGLADGIAGRAGSAGTGAGGAVTVKVSGTVQARGKDATGVFAQSAGSGVSAINIAVQKGGVVYGGSGNAAAIELAGGANNLIEIAEGAQVSALSGVAIRTLTDEEETTVNNHGLLLGSIILDQNRPGVLNNFGTLQAGTSLILTTEDPSFAAIGQFTNSGILSIGLGDDMAATLLKGNYRQNSTGSYQPRVNYSLGTADLFSVTGAAYLDGKLAVAGRGHFPGKTITVLQAQSGLTLAENFSSQGNAVFDYPVIQNGNNLSVGIAADFTRNADVLSEEQSAVAEYLGRKWDEAEEQVQAASPAVRTLAATRATAAASSLPAQAYVDVFDTVAQADDTKAYENVLNQIGNDAIQAPAAIMPLAHRMFLNRTLSCPSTDQTPGAASDQDCLWGDIQGNWLDRRGSHDDTGFDYDSVRYMLGGQHPLGNGWVAGGGVSYEEANGKAKHIVLKNSGHSVSGVAFLRKIDGAWSYTGALSAGYGSYDTNRAVMSANGVVQPDSDWNTYFAALRMQAAYTHQMDDLYVKPSLDVDVFYQRVPSYSEKGGGAFNLAFDSASDVRTMISPSVEFGGRIETADLVLKPYAGLGVNWMPGNDWRTDVRLKSDPSGDRFHLSQSLPSFFAEYRLGMDIETVEGLLLRAEWRQRVGDRYNDHSAQLQFGMRF